jgi:hypothetical protein
MTKTVLLRSSLLVIALAAALTAAGCGKSNKTTSTTEWANNLCTAINTWNSSLSSAVGSLQGGNLSKSGVDSAWNDAKGATETFVSDLKGLGKPDTEAGQQAKDSVDQLADEVNKGKDQIQDALDNASGLSGLIAAVPTVTGTLTTMSKEISSTVSSIRNIDAQGELRTAFKQADACTGLNQGG